MKNTTAFVRGQQRTHILFIKYLNYVLGLYWKSYITGLVAVKNAKINLFTNILFLVCFCPFVLKLLSRVIVHTYLMVGYCLSVVHTKERQDKNLTKISWHNVSAGIALGVIIKAWLGNVCVFSYNCFAPISWVHCDVIANYTYNFTTYSAKTVSKSHWF